METTDLLLTWQTLIELLQFPKNKHYEIEFLDSIFDIKLQVSSKDYIILISTYHNENETKRKKFRNMYLAIGNCVKRQLILYATCHHYLLMN